MSGQSLARVSALEKLNWPTTNSTENFGNAGNLTSFLNYSREIVGFQKERFKT